MAQKRGDVGIEDLRVERWGEAEARRALELWERSGLSMAEFARQSVLSLPRMRWWRARFRAEAGISSDTHEFVPVVARRVAPASRDAVVIRLGEVTIEVADPSVVEPTWLAEMIAAVARGVSS